MEQHEWMLLLLAIGATFSCTRTSECESALAQSFTVSLHASFSCHREWVRCFCFGLMCVFVVWFAFPGGIVDVFLNLASLDMTATVLSNAASGKKSQVSLSHSLRYHQCFVPDHYHHEDVASVIITDPEPSGKSQSPLQHLLHLL